MSRMLIAATAALFLSAPVMAETKNSFSQDGVIYTYSVQDYPKARVITGYSSISSNYRLVVRNGRVSGHVNGNRVSFSVKDAKLDGLVEVAQR